MSILIQPTVATPVTVRISRQRWRELSSEKVLAASIHDRSLAQPVIRKVLTVDIKARVSTGENKEGHGGAPSSNNQHGAHNVRLPSLATQCRFPQQSVKTSL
jgi:hypothetical protein